MSARLDWYRRLLATAFSFTVFGLGGVVLTLTAFPMLLVFVRTTQKRRHYAQRLISRSFSYFIELMRVTGILDYKVYGRERLQQAGCIVVANHPSLIDVVLLISLMPEVNCIVKRDLWSNLITGLPVRAAGYISNSDGPELMESCQAVLGEGGRLLIFPEGTRTVPGKSLSLQRGAANIAAYARANLLPVTIVFEETTLSKGDHWYDIPSKRMQIIITVDEPLAIASYLEDGTSKPLAARRLTRDLRDYYIKQLAQAGRLPEHDKPRVRA